jgi:hypothetical protein
LGEAPDVGKEEHLEQRRAEHRGDVVRPVHPVEERAIRQVPTDEEHAQIAHVSASVARSRASFSNCRSVKWPITR